MGATPDTDVKPDGPDVFEAHPSQPSPSGSRQVPGGHTAESATYRLVKTTAPPPGATIMQSQTYKLIGGIVGATQK